MKLRGGIQTKLFLLISALAVAITLSFTIGGWRWYAASATQALEQKALTYGQLVGALSCQSLVASREGPRAALVVISKAALERELSAH
jgi:hypothetical protein